jgi:HEAT repeat protein
VALPLLVWIAPAMGQETSSAPAQSQEAKLIAVLKSDAPSHAKADACLVLSRIATKEAVAPLVALLGDEKLGHMARYALEPIPDRSVDEALRAALGQLKERPLLGVIGSLGVRRDARSVGPLSRLLKDANPAVAQAAARALGSVGTAEAARALQKAWEVAAAGQPAENQAAIAEGLLRCAETLSAHDGLGQAVAIYQLLGGSKLPQPIREAALKKARLLTQAEGPRL